MNDSIIHPPMLCVQLKAYQEDFERERQAREAAVKVKNMVEERIAKKEKEVKELRDRLNQQAMHTLNVEEPVRLHWMIRLV